MAIMQVPVTKGKGFVEFDTDALPEAVFAEVVLQGLKTLVNRGMSKCTVKDLGDEATVRKEAMIIAEQQKAKIMSGEIKFTGKAKAKSGVSKEVTTEAMRIARDRVRDALKAAGKKLSYVPAKEITAAAKELVGLDPSILAQAEANIASRAETPSAIDLSALVAGLAEDPAKVAKAEEKKAAKQKDKPLSAKQAGMVKGRKPQAKPAHHTSH